MKTSELTGSALDLAVAQAWYGPEYDINVPLFDDGLIFQPSALWQHGGPIIERECINLKENGAGWWFAKIGDNKKDKWVRGTAPLMAAMRCFVASKLGDEVSTPAEFED
jgi:hypothetical protein